MTMFLASLRAAAAGLCIVPVALIAQSAQLRRPIHPVQEIFASQTMIQDELHQMAAEAGVIFAGRVLEVHQPETPASGWVQIDFFVEEAVRGCQKDSVFHLREWPGLWAGGLLRYRPGQELLMILHPPGTSGLSSPVGGQDGAIPIQGVGMPPAPESTLNLLSNRIVDLKWIEARILRSTAEDLPFHARSLSSAAQAKKISDLQAARSTKGMRPPTVPQPQPSAMSASPKHPPTSPAATLQSVLSALRIWEAQQPDGAQ